MALAQDIMKQTILVVDDTLFNIDLIKAALSGSYFIEAAVNGEMALKIVEDKKPDLILLDIMMPEMDGYEVCKRLKANAATRDIPVIFLTAKSEVADETKGFEHGAVDYITKPVSLPILRARVRTHLALYTAVRQLEEWNLSLERRVSEGIAKIERLDRMRRFFSPAVADALLADQAESYLRARRREIVVIFLDLRGYTAFTEANEPEEVMRVLGELHAGMGELIMAYNGTLERFTGDGMMVFFNAPVEIPDFVIRGVKMAIDMQARMTQIGGDWQRRGYDLAMGIGIAQGLATIGSIGFEGRRDYGAIGSVVNIAARLCGEAKGGQILCCELTMNNIRGQVKAVPVPDLILKGFAQPIKAFEISKNDQWESLVSQR